MLSWWCDCNLSCLPTWCQDTCHVADQSQAASVAPVVTTGAWPQTRHFYDYYLLFVTGISCFLSWTRQMTRETRGWQHSQFPAAPPTRRNIQSCDHSMKDQFATPYYLTRTCKMNYVWICFMTAASAKSQCWSWQVFNQSKCISNHILPPKQFSQAITGGFGLVQG